MVRALFKPPPRLSMIGRASTLEIEMEPIQMKKVVMIGRLTIMVMMKVVKVAVVTIVMMKLTKNGYNLRRVVSR